ncbi:hypothetical protein [Azospirillum argentinense]
MLCKAAQLARHHATGIGSNNHAHRPPARNHGQPDGGDRGRVRRDAEDLGAAQGAADERRGERVQDKRGEEQREPGEPSPAPGQRPAKPDPDHRQQDGLKREERRHIGGGPVDGGVALPEEVPGQPRPQRTRRCRRPRRAGGGPTAGGAARPAETAG